MCVLKDKFGCSQENVLREAQVELGRHIEGLGNNGGSVHLDNDVSMKVDRISCFQELF